MRNTSLLSCAILIAAALAPAPALAEETEAAKTAAKSAPKKKKPAASKPKPAPAQPDNLTAATVRHVVTCPPPKVSNCVMRKPIASGYRVLTPGIEIQDDGANWIVDFGKGPKSPKFLFEVLELGGSLHDIEVSFFAKAGAQKAPPPIE